MDNLSPKTGAPKQAILGIIAHLAPFVGTAQIPKITKLAHQTPAIFQNRTSKYVFGVGFLRVYLLK
ncbi:hypothetical protein B0181_05105 [Moraxella caviae]|uniref:Uncharacterized protein n=1 Tax=Moraxella caviae TaxID=34060 RepID=A0A1T0A363_9GAMM|nr:hypothetical protein B0181_05105 [Moraxella caviae]